jgi:DNA repair exonuclease SbcCD nuclease subunit
MARRAATATPAPAAAPAAAPMTFAGRFLPLFSDLHVRADNTETTIGIVRAMREEAIALGARTVGFLGDFYHVRGLMPVTLQNAVVDELDAWARAGLKLIVLTGNHDQVDVSGRHALEVFRAHPAVVLHERPTVDEWGLWIPYMHDLDDVRRVLDQHRTHAECPGAWTGVAFWHGPMIGAAMNDRTFADRGLSIEDFRGYALAALGHFHKRQSFGHVSYVGSPWETRADEGGQAKGYAILDYAATRLVHVDRAWGPKHVVVQADSAADALAQLAGVGAEARVRVSVPEAAIDAINKALAGKVADFVVSPSAVAVTSARALPNARLTLREHAERLVDERAGEMDKAHLLRAYEEFAQ